jgi:transcriptional regulator GlxA family with amidase domain
VVDGPRITCSGGAGVADLAALIIERHLGRATAQKAMHVLLLPYARSGSDAQPHSPVAEAIRDERVHRAVLMMEQNIAKPMPVESIATKLKVSHRQLERLFRSETGRSPGAVYREVRLRHARWLIENTRLTMTQIADATGFCDSAHFSRQFKQLFALSPRSLKRVAREGRAPAALPGRTDGRV